MRLDVFAIDTQVFELEGSKFNVNVVLFLSHSFTSHYMDTSE